MSRGWGWTTGAVVVLASCAGSGVTDITEPGPSDQPAIERSATAATAATDTAPPGTPDTSSRSARLAFTGDTLAHSPLWRQAQRNTGGSGYDFFPMFANVSERLSASDLAVCHLETPIAPDGEEFSTDPLYGVPPGIVEAMARAGYDRCSTASNHILDRYAHGVDRTIEVLEQHGLGQSGAARNEAESLPSVFDVNGIAMAHLSYTYGTNGIPVPSDEPWRTNLIDPAGVIDDARIARERGAEFVMVSMHWGTEKVAAPNEQQLTVADEITASGLIDLVIGHHAHVVQPLEEVNGVWVAYGIGNILSNLPVNDAWPAASQDAVILEVDVFVDSAGVVDVGRPVAYPTWVDKDNAWVIHDVDATLGRADIEDWRRDLLERSRERTAEVLGDFFPAP